MGALHTYAQAFCPEKDQKPLVVVFEHQIIWKIQKIGMNSSQDIEEAPDMVILWSPHPPFLPAPGHLWMEKVTNLLYLDT